MAGKQQAPAVPGIPLSALGAIKDQNVRQVLQALVDAHHVRNGNAGSGDNRFITAAEVGLTGGRTGLAVAGGGQDARGGSTKIKPSDIARIINDLQALVIESPLFKDLGERVDLIDKPDGIFTRLGQVEVVVKNEITQRQSADEAEIRERGALGVRVGAAEGAILNETTLRTNATAALVQTMTNQYTSINESMALVRQQVETTSNAVASYAQQFTQVQAAVGDNATAIQQVARASADADGVINAKYTVKIDSNGYVAGYGLMSTANNSVPYSDFTVRADRFAIGSPSGPGIAPQVPFIVATTPFTRGGRVYQPGVYMNKTFVAELYGTYIDAGYLKAAKIYSGSQYVDLTSNIDIPAAGGSSWLNGLISDTTEPATDAGLRFYGPNLHGSAPYYQRVRGTSNLQLVAFTVTASATVDHFLSIWYRHNTGAWLHLAKNVEPQNGDGANMVARTAYLHVNDGDFIDFAVSASNEGGAFIDGSKRYIKNLVMTVQTINL